MHCTKYIEPEEYRACDTCNEQYAYTSRDARTDRNKCAVCAPLVPVSSN
jgi:hypothetical protein